MASELPKQIEKNIDSVLEYLFEEIKVLNKFKIEVAHLKERLEFVKEGNTNLTIQSREYVGITGTLFELVRVLEKLLQEQEMNLLPQKKREIQQFRVFIHACADKIFKILGRGNELDILISQNATPKEIESKINEVLGNQRTPGINGLINLLERLEKLETKLVSSYDYEKRIAQLQEWGFPIEKYPDLAHLLAENWSDILEIAQRDRKNMIKMFKFWLPAVSKSITPNNWPEIVKTGRQVYQYFPEWILLYSYMERLLLLINNTGIDIVYALDKSARVLGFLLVIVLNNLDWLKDVKVYFMNVDKLEGGILYSEKQKQGLKGKKVLVIDEVTASGETMAKATSYLQKFGAKVYSSVFANEMGTTEPSWHSGFYGSQDNYSGVREIKGGFVEVVKESRKFTVGVRKALIVLGKSIAKVLKMKGY